MTFSVVNVQATNNIQISQLQNDQAKQMSSFSQKIVNDILHGNTAELSKYYSKYINQNNINELISGTKLLLPAACFIPSIYCFGGLCGIEDKYSYNQACTKFK